ncbi:MAG TPA: hypothetical protein VFV99_24700 [Kofleriaceae bacterium]|nr:hypothetical protein [Kofleriaceae bacterium]
MQYLVALLTVAAVACGPSSKEVGTAKAARYQGDKLTLFAATKAAVESKYKLQKSDETTLGMQTEGRWFTPEGMAVTREGGNGTSTRDMGGGMTRTDADSQFPDGSVNITLVVTLLPDGSNWIVKVTPVMLRFHAGMPKPDPVPENDPSVPGWATSKVDQLAVDIHSALAKYEVKQLGGLPPPPAPGPSPDEPSAGSAAAPPAAGSAAGSAAP